MPSVDHREVPLHLRAPVHYSSFFTCRSWCKFFAGKNLVTAQMQLHLYNEQQRAYRISNISGVSAHICCCKNYNNKLGLFKIGSVQMNNKAFCNLFCNPQKFFRKWYYRVWRMVESLYYLTRKITERCENSFVDYRINYQKLRYLMRQIKKDLISAIVKSLSILVNIY